MHCKIADQSRIDSGYVRKHIAWSSEPLRQDYGNDCILRLQAVSFAFCYTACSLCVSTRLWMVQWKSASAVATCKHGRYLH